ncbi:unnamed protein product, partial [Callosobruchus maculatus]
MEELIRKRGSVRASLTNFSKYVCNLEKLDELSEENLLDLETRVNTIECSMLQKFTDIQDSIEAVCDEAILDREYTNRSDFEDKYYKVLASAKKILVLNKNSSENDIGSASAHSVRSEGHNFIKQQEIQLPIINLPVFDGSLQNWLEFRDVYDSLIHTN